MKLKPCPFCKATPEFATTDDGSVDYNCRRIVHIGGCYLEGRIRFLYAKDFESWNRRQFTIKEVAA